MRPSDKASGAEPPTYATATAQRGDIIEQLEYEGTLGHGKSVAVKSVSQGVLTWLPPEGAVVHRGEPLYAVADRPVPLLIGRLPLYRDLGPTVSDGSDVEQLEKNLVAMGFSDSLTVDDQWTSATTDAVQAWQKSMDWEETGTVRMSEVLVLPGARRIQTHEAVRGDSVSPGIPLVTTTGTKHVVSVALPAEDVDFVEPGNAVGVQLPDGSDVTGTVVKESRVVSVKQGEQGEADELNVEVRIEVADSDRKAAARYDQAPVTVTIRAVHARGVIVVPVEALVALSGGGYAVETLVQGIPQLRAVAVGDYSAGKAAITAGLGDGDEVVVPS